MIPILYKDDHFIVVNKPQNIPVHRSPMVMNHDQFLIELVQKQIGKQLYPVHRLDSKTSGVLIIALEPRIARLFQEQFKAREVNKSYRAIVRGHINQPITIDYDLVDPKGKVQEAVTEIYPLSLSEIPLPFGKHPTSRYSLIEAKPLTGRYHQIRKHLKHIFHPIIGDRPHGCNKQNRLFKAKWNMNDMLLHAHKVNCNHPIEASPLEFIGEHPLIFSTMLRELRLDL